MESHPLFLDRMIQYLKDVKTPKNYNFNPIPVKTLSNLFMELEKIFLKFNLKSKHVRLARKHSENLQE